MSECHATCCGNEQTDEHRPYCSRQCQRITRLAKDSGPVPARRDTNWQFVPPEIAPWPWLDARAEAS